MRLRDMHDIVFKMHTMHQATSAGRPSGLYHHATSIVGTDSSGLGWVGLV
jgi:hypothetical protein